MVPVAGNVYAFLTESLDDEYEVDVLRGAVAGARETGATVLCVAGGAIADADPDRRARNFAFDLVGPHNVNGVLALSSVLGSAIGPLELAKWMERWRGLPLFCLGVPLDGHPCIQVDNAGGLKAVVLHLIREHRARRIAFVRGPPGSAEAEIRLRAYQDALSQEGIEADPSLLCEGDFSKPSGARAIGALIDAQRRASPGFDAVAAANDYMALGVLHELARRKILVPEQVAVAGFDDVESARLARPALTTVSQPTELLGRQGMRALSAQIQRRVADPETRLPTELVVRRSCGCSVVEAGLAFETQPGAGRGLETSFVQRRQIILAEMARAARGRFGSAGTGWESRVLDALLVELRGAEPASLNRALEQLLMRLERSKIEADVIQEVLTALRRQSLACVGADRTARDRLEDALHDARVFASRFAEEEAASRHHQALERLNHFKSAIRSAMFKDGSELSRVAATQLPEFGIEACVVTELSKPGDPASGARVFFGYGPGGKLASTEPIALRALSSHELLERSGRTQILLPIVLHGQALGIMLVSVVTLDGGLLEELRDLFGSALKVSSMRRGVASI